MKVKVYIVSTPYHILSGIVDLEKSQKKGVFVLISNYPDDYEYFKYEKKRLEKHSRVENVIIIEPRNILGRLFGYKKEYQLLVENYDIYSVNFFSWNLNKLYTNSNYFFKKFKKGYSIDFFEDGSNVYLSQTTLQRPFTRVLQFILGIYTTSQALKFVNNVYVSYPEKFPAEMKPKIIKRNVSMEVKKLANGSKEMLGETFLDDEIDLAQILSVKKKNILFTQPLAQDKFMSVDRQKKLYNDLIKKYSANSESLIIKKHPRDSVSYETNKNCILLPRKFPSELLNMYDTKFVNSIGISSSATKSIKAVNYVDESKRLKLV